MDMKKYIGAMFLKIDDVKASGPIRVRIAEISEGRYGKPDLTFHDGTILSLNATNGRVLAREYGLESDNWIDQEIELDVGEIPYQGKPQEAIVVKPISPSIENKASGKKPEFDDEIPYLGHVAGEAAPRKQLFRSATNVIEPAFDQRDRRDHGRRRGRR